MSRRCLCRGTISPVFRDRLRRSVSVADRAQGLGLAQISPVRKLVWRPRSELIRTLQRKRHDLEPVWGEKALRRPLSGAEWLPPIRVDEVIRAVDRCIARVVRIGGVSPAEIAQLICTVAVSPLQNRETCRVPDSRGRRHVRRRVARIEPQFGHQTIEQLELRREQVRERPIGRVADGNAFVGRRPFVARPA